jgi:hypothetical protein
VKLALIIIAFLSASAMAHEIQSLTQHVNIQRQNQEGWQQDLIGKVTASRKWDLGLQGTYLERFDLYEKRAGMMAAYRPTEAWTLEAKYLAATNKTEILPRNQAQLGAYFAYAPGLTPYLSYRDSKYSVTHLNQGALGIEIEKFQNILLIPQVMYGKVTFASPAQTRDIHNFGLRAIYYREKIYSLFLFGNKGTEASQGIIGESNIIVNTLTGGFGGSYYFVPQLKTELIVDYTDYHELKNQFLTTTLNLVWVFE